MQGQRIGKHFLSNIDTDSTSSSDDEDYAPGIQSSLHKFLIGPNLSSTRNIIMPPFPEPMGGEDLKFLTGDGGEHIANEATASIVGSDIEAKQSAPKSAMDEI